MRFVLTLIALALVQVGFAADQENESAKKQAQKPATTVPEKPNRNQHDPGITIMQMAVPEDPEASPEESSKPRVKKEKEPGTPTFGDGEQGRIPQDQKAAGDGKRAKMKGAGKSKQKDTDPDK